MDAQQLNRMYQEATALAEAGQHEPALSRMFEYLRHRPLDGVALNDAGTILFCLRRGQDAIACYEKAAQLCQGDQLAQIHWNLCEAFLQENQPARAIAIFDAMEMNGTLSIDLLNRAADALLRQELLGPAVELLLRSLQINSDQEVLVPMLEIIRSHRARLAVVVHNKRVLAQSLAESFKDRLSVTALEETSSQPLQIPADANIALFFGVGQTLSDVSQRTSEMRRVVILDAQDMVSPHLRQVNWQAVHTVIFCGGADLKELFSEQLGRFPAGFRTLFAEPIPNPDGITFTPRNRGKRIAAVGPWDAHRNPMFALMCFQKLHFLDADTRLHIAGEFVDPLTERYTRQTIETLGLDNVVFVDGPVKDLKKWLKDKHFVLSASIDGSGLEEVWLAMACGLRPVVHTFPGAAERLDGQYLFTLAEDFCERVLHGHYDAAQHRAAVELSFARMGLEPMISDLIFSLEKEMPLSNRHLATETRANPPAVSASSMRPVGQIASEVLTSIQPAQMRSEERQRTPHFRPSEPASHQENKPDGNSSTYNPLDGLSIEELTREDADSVPFSVGA